MTRRLSVGLLGAGEVAQLIHLPIFHQLSDRFDVVSLYDPSPTVVARVAAHWSIPRTYTSVEAFLADPALDAVMILSPDQFHEEHARAAFAAGLHVFLEKPACLTDTQFARLQKDFEVSDRVGMVGYMRCYAPAFTKAQSLLPTFRKIRHVRVRDIICEGPWFFDSWAQVAVPDGDIPPDLLSSGRQARHDAIMSICGTDAPAHLLRGYEVLTGLGIHAFSAMRVLLGRPHRVIAAHIGASGTEINIWFDYGTFIASYECLIDDVARFDSSLEVIGDTQRMELRYDTPYIRNLPGRVIFHETVGTDNTVTEFGPYYQDPFQAELIAFHAAVLNGAPLADAFPDAAHDLALCREIMVAAKANPAAPPGR